MTRHESQATTNQRREVLLYLSLLEHSCREARILLCLSDEIGENARKPSLVLAGADRMQQGQAERINQAAELGRGALMQLNEVMAFGQKLAACLNIKSDVATEGESP